jgi:hypothetical protein
MRERANKATASPWEPEEGTAVISQYSDEGFCITYDDDMRADDAEHIASWHPAVALTVADLIDRIAWTWEVDPDLQGRAGGEELLAMARAYLAGEQP